MARPILPTPVVAEDTADLTASREHVALTGAQEVHENVEVTVEAMAGVTRRQVLVRSGGLLAALALAGAGAGAVGRALKHRFGAAESRANVTLPTAADPLAPIPDAVDVGVDGVAPFTTPNADFYRIDTALTVPQLPTEDYELRITGMVDRELRFSFDDLLRRNVVEYDITLTCVSNTIGGNLIGNARWLGRPAGRTARGGRRPAPGPIRSSVARSTATRAASRWKRPPTVATPSSPSG